MNGMLPVTLRNCIKAKPVKKLITLMFQNLKNKKEMAKDTCKQTMIYALILIAIAIIVIVFSSCSYTTYELQQVTKTKHGYKVNKNGAWSTDSLYRVVPVTHYGRKPKEMPEKLVPEDSLRQMVNYRGKAKGNAKKYVIKK